MTRVLPKYAAYSLPNALKYGKKKQPAECLQHCDEPNRNGSYGDHVMATKPLPSQEVLRQLLRYEPSTGKLFWNIRPAGMFASLKSCRTWNTRFAGKEALSTLSSHGYKVGELLGKKYLAHRVIWAIHYGSGPKFQIDHIDGDRTNNLLQNLRDVDPSTNQRNQKRRSDNTTGQSGVTMHKPTGKWRAEVFIKGRSKHLGLFDSFDDAVAARKKEAIKNGYTERHGSV